MATLKVVSLGTLCRIAGFLQVEEGSGHYTLDRDIEAALPIEWSLLILIFSVLFLAKRLLLFMSCCGAPMQWDQVG